MTVSSARTRARTESPRGVTIADLGAYVLALPWHEVERCSIEPWSVTLDGVEGELVLDARELFDLCAAVELERLTHRDVSRIRAHLDQRRRTRLPWSMLADRCPGLTPGDAPGALTIAEVLTHLRLSFVRAEIGAGVEGVRGV